MSAIEHLDVLFDDHSGIYNYCPTVIKERTTLHLWYCSNRDPFVIIDYIGYRRIRKWNTPNPQVSKKHLVMGPGDVTHKDWDFVHACDPSIIKGKFIYRGERYRYLMAYLGCATLDCTYNEVGIAFANAPVGPWVKYHLNPVVKYEVNRPRAWGVGQPSLVSLNRRNHVRIFYTQGDHLGSGIYFVDLAFRLTQVVMSKPIAVPFVGLTPLVPHDSLVNGDFMFDAEKNCYWVVRDTRHRDGSFPSIITTTCQYAFISKSQLEDGSGFWSTSGAIGPTQSGFPRNHNAGWVRDAYGWKPLGTQEIIFTVSPLSTSNEELSYLWKYRLHRYIL